MGLTFPGPVNLPPPCLWRRCPVLHHDRIVSALVIQFVHWRVMRWTSIDSQARISPVCGQPKTDLWLRGRFSAEVGSRRASQAASITRAGIWREVSEFVRLPLPLLRVCPKTSGGITKFSEHEAD